MRIKTNTHQNKPNGRKKLFKFLLIGIVFCSVIMFQSYRINKVNLEILELESKVKDVTMINDSLEGDVMAKRDLNKIEKVAINKYGMIKPTEKNFNYIAVKKDKNNTLAKAKTNTDEKEEKSFIGNLFSGFANN